MLNDAVPPPSPHTLPQNIPSKPADDSREKKPRVRHTEAQLAALNDLYDDDEHPSLEARAALAENLSMETKAVNAWFANKRSATKKKIKGPAAAHSTGADTPPPSARTADSALLDDDDEDWAQHSYAWSTPPPGAEWHPAPGQASFPTGVSEHRHVFDGESGAGVVPRRMRMRPSVRQTDELRKLYSVSSHPSREEREELGIRIGMRYQSVTNWFQNQRSLAKKRKEDEASDAQVPQQSREASYTEPPAQDSPHTYTAFPPASAHPSLGAPSPMQSISLEPMPLSRIESVDPKPVTARRNGSSGPVPRPRRTRPEPYQLEALKKLYSRTANPSIEERGALALEVGMDIGKVTNWFRNLRQTARKRAVKASTEDGEYDGMDFESAPVSRAGSPSPPSSSTSSSVNGDDGMDVDSSSVFDVRHAPHSDLGSEEDYQEALTPPPGASPSLPSTQGAGRRMDVGFLTGVPASAPPSNFSKSATESVRMEDALLLLSFSKHIPQ